MEMAWIQTESGTWLNLNKASKMCVESTSDMSNGRRTVRYNAVVTLDGDKYVVISSTHTYLERGDVFSLTRGCKLVEVDNLTLRPLKYKASARERMELFMRYILNLATDTYCGNDWAVDKYKSCCKEDSDETD